MSFVVGIDGGGTKTKALLADETGKVIASTVAGASNPNVVKENELAKVFNTLFASLKQKCQDMAENTTSLYAGISGAGNQENRKIIQKILTKYFTNSTVIKVEVDAVNALYAGTYGKPGIVQISGTGSITYGKNSQGLIGRVGGWGYLFGDEGSGYDIGRRAVTAALKAYDGRGPETLLLHMLKTHFQLDDPQELIRSIYTTPSPKNKISPLTHIVFQAYQQNDSAAREIIHQTVRELSLHITVLHNKLFSPDDKIPIVLSGGIFQEKEIIPSLLMKESNALNFVLPKMSPAGGALIGAYLMKEKQVGEKVIENIIHTE